MDSWVDPSTQEFVIEVLTDSGEEKLFRGPKVLYRPFQRGGRKHAMDGCKVKVTRTARGASVEILS